MKHALKLLVEAKKKNRIRDNSLETDESDTEISLRKSSTSPIEELSDEADL